MTHPEKPSTRGFGPIALIMTGVVCFAAGYMVNDLTKALGGGVPEHKPGSSVATPGPRDADPVSEQQAADSQDVPVSAPDEPAKAPEKKDEEKPAPAGGAGAPPPKG